MYNIGHDAEDLEVRMAGDLDRLKGRIIYVSRIGGYSVRRNSVNRARCRIKETGKARRRRNERCGYSRRRWNSRERISQL